MKVVLNQLQPVFQRFFTVAVQSAGFCLAVLDCKPYSQLYKEVLSKVLLPKYYKSQLVRTQVLARCTVAVNFWQFLGLFILGKLLLPQLNVVSRQLLGRSAMNP